MSESAKEATTDPFAYESLSQLLTDCVEFYNRNLREITNASVTRAKRRALAKWIRKFHQDAGTTTSEVEDAVGNLEDTPSLLLMTAHQPNLFAYSGVLRKATLISVLAESLLERLHVPVICFFGIADQDFTDDRWVRSAILPDIKRRNGILELRADVPPKMMLNRVEKPSVQVLNDWRKEVETWFNQKFAVVERTCKDLQVAFSLKQAALVENFNAFWKIVERAHQKAKNYADFNAFIISEIVNNVWHYPTVFARFSECQEILEDEFCSILSNFNDYSRCVKEAICLNRSGGVGLDEFETIPFWFHCECGGKARLTAVFKYSTLIGSGFCLGCGKNYSIDFGSTSEPKISEFLSRISARSISMPLAFFSALRVCAYVGGVGGKQYLRQAMTVAERMGMPFPPVVVWRPTDCYIGIAQLEAVVLFRLLSGSFDLSKYWSVTNNLKEQIANVKKLLQELGSQKRELVKNTKLSQQKRIREIKALSTKQSHIRSEAHLSLLVRNLKLLENFLVVVNLHPCIIDYAVNIGLSATNEAWVTFLKERGDLSVNVDIETDFGDLANRINPEFCEEWKELVQNRAAPLMMRIE